MKNQTLPATEPIHLIGGIFAAAENRVLVKKENIHQQNLRSSHIHMSSGLISKTNSVSYTFRWNLGDEFARNTAYNEVGELNNIIIIYPQAISINITNPLGCWDYWGYTSSFYCK